VAVLFLCLLAAPAGRAEVFRLPNGARLELFPVGDWKIRSEDVGEYKILFAPEHESINAVATFSISTEGSDDFPTHDKLTKQIAKVAERLTASGEFVERRPEVKAFYSSQGFGYYVMLTDAKLVGRAPVPGDYKKVCLGMIRLAPSVLVKVQILSDGEDTEGFQQLLGIAEGLAYTVR
jgi:hypothetical protein